MNDGQTWWRRHGALTVLCGSLLMIGWVVYGVSTGRGAEYFGTVAAWASALGTTASVSTALWFSMRSDRRAELERRRAQADRVASWNRGGTGSEGWSQGIEGVSGSYSIRVTNQSDLPVYNAHFRVVSYSDGAVLRTDPVFVARARVVPPGTWEAEIRGVLFEDSSIAPSVEMAFTDSHGTHWFRDGYGVLVGNPKTPTDHYRADQNPAGIDVVNLRQALQ